ncbi:MAG: helix-turn-helix domain-containing protein [Phycisphaerae bacterium]
MRSDEVLRRAADTVGVKALAAELRLSSALIYKWCQEWDPDDPDAGGARNPLDRVADIVRITGDREVVNWLCHEAGGFLVPNPSEPPSNVSTELLVNTQRLVKEFSQLLLTVTKSIEDDGKIEPAEADRIRNAWELFKTTVEAFTVACERGAFRTNVNRNG